MGNIRRQPVRIPAQLVAEPQAQRDTLRQGIRLFTHGLVWLRGSRFKEQCQPSLERLGRHAGYGGVLEHVRTSEAAGTAEDGRPEVNQLLEMMFPVGKVFVKNGPECFVVSHLCIEGLYQMSSFFVGAKIR